jgi:transposase
MYLWSSGCLRIILYGQFASLTVAVLRTLSPKFDALYAEFGRPSIAPEYILRALLLQVFYSVRSERLLVEQIDYNRLA